MEVIAKDADGREQRKEILLNNGDKILFHLEDAYEDFYPDGKSFDELPSSEGKWIRFLSRAKFHRDGIEQLAATPATAGPKILSNPLMVHHQNVAWVYQAGIELVQDGVCRLVLLSIGPSFKVDPVTPKGGIGNNVPRRQSAPEAEVCYSLGSKEEEENEDDQHKKRSFRMEKNGDGFVSEETVPMDTLLKLTGETTTSVRLLLDITIKKDYFQLDQLMETKLDRLPILPEAQRLLAAVLRGEKTPGWDWVITVGQGGEPTNFFVHGQVLAHSSPLLEVAMRTHRSLGKENQLLMVSHENRFILPQTRSEDMAPILSYFYLRSCSVLPSWMAFARVGRTLCALLPPYALGSMFAFWEEAIVRDAASVDRKDYARAIPQLTRHLVSVNSCPFGAMPAARCVLISTLADVWHMAESRGVDLKAELENEDCFQMDVIQQVRPEIDNFKLVAATVKKEAI